MSDRAFFFMSILSVSNLRKVYGDTLAVDDLSFSTEPGEIVGLLGPNGAGKTTTINMILGVLEPSGGQIQIDRYRPRRRTGARRCCGRTLPPFTRRFPAI